MLFSGHWNVLNIALLCLEIEYIECIENVLLCISLMKLLLYTLDQMGKKQNVCILNITQDKLALNNQTAYVIKPNIIHLD